MASELEIVNMALARLGQSPIPSLDRNQIGVAGIKTIAFMRAALDQVLSEHDWLEATQEITLNAIELSGETGKFKYILALPVDFLRVSQIQGGGEWRIGTHLMADGITRLRVIYAEAMPSECQIIVRLPWDQLPAQLMWVVVLKIAHMACYSVTGDTRVKKDIAEDLLVAVAQAQFTEAFNEGGIDYARGGLHEQRYLAR